MARFRARIVDPDVSFESCKTKVLDRLKGQLNARQEKALLRMFREGPEGFRGGLSAGKYSTITGASPATTTRDLADLVAKGALVRESECRYARYHLSVPLRADTRRYAQRTGRAGRKIAVPRRLGRLSADTKSTAARLLSQLWAQVMKRMSMGRICV
jgi:hypothetical protein